MEEKVLKAILDAYPCPVVYCDREHVVRFFNRNAYVRYHGRIEIGQSIFNCHNAQTKEKIIAFLKRADEGEGEMLEAYNPAKQDREFFTPVRDEEGKVIGYFERHETWWDKAPYEK